MAVVSNILSQNIVLVTENINPSMFNLLWFVNNNIYKAEEILQDSVFVPGFTSVSTIDSQITIVPNQIQMALKDDDTNKSLNCVTNHFLKLIQAVQTLPIRAIGINFMWKVADDELPMCQVTRKMFGTGALPIYSYFSEDNARLGAYFSQDVDTTTRLKLDIKPVRANDNNKGTEFLLASFNYHCDLTGDGAYEVLLNQLLKWENLRTNSAQVVCLLK